LYSAIKSEDSHCRPLYWS